MILLTLPKETEIMTYIIVKDRQTVVGAPFASFTAALQKANALFGDDVNAWMDLNLRVEENRIAM